MKRIFRKILFIFLLCLLPLNYFGCKQVINPAGGINEFITGYITSESSPIPGIKVSSNYGYTISDENGYFEILSYYLVDTSDDNTIYLPQKNAKHELVFTDIDGEANGKLKQKTVFLDPEVTSPISIIMDKE